MKTLEYRTSFEALAFRADDEDVEASTAGFSGYASTFNRVDSYGSAFSPDAFTKTIAERGDRIPVLYNHNPNANVGVPEVLKADKRGLYVEARLFNDGAEGSTLIKRLRQGARYGMSFGFRTVQDRKATEDDNIDLDSLLNVDSLYDGVRLITEVKLYEVSPVTFPANEDADITAVRAEVMTDALAEALEALRDGSLNERQRAIVAAIVAANAASPDASSAPREPEIAQRRIDIDLALARFRFGL